MTVQYYQKVLTGGPAVFFRLLARWRGSVLKLVYLDFAIFAISYTVLSIVYRLAMSPEWKRSFERIVIHVNQFQTLIPMAFILGFYVSIIFARFWKHFCAVPWTIKISMSLVSHLFGQTERIRLMRRSIVRYLNAALVLTVTRLHVSAKKRFPTLEHIVTAGILSSSEMEILEKIEPSHARPYVPIIWATAIITRAEREGLISNTHALVNMITQVNEFRAGCASLFMMDQVCVPLLYTQVVTLAVYTYFMSCIIGRQFIENSSPLSTKEREDFYVPFFTILEFFIYMGWLKVAETMVNPMGEDDEDFDVNEIIDFNWKVSLFLVDEMSLFPPDIVRDAHWDVEHIELPHTEQSKRFERKPYMGSVFDLHLPIIASSNQSLQSGTNSVHDEGHCVEELESPVSLVHSGFTVPTIQSFSKQKRNQSMHASAPIQEVINEVEENDLSENEKEDDAVFTTEGCTLKQEAHGDQDSGAEERQTLLHASTEPGNKVDTKKDS